MLNVAAVSDRLLDALIEAAVSEYETVRDENDGSRLAAAAAVGGTLRTLEGERAARRERSACCIGAATTGNCSALCPR